MPREFKTILCPTDFSAASGHAIEYGARFARGSDGTLLIAHVLHIPTEHYRDEHGEVFGFDVLKSRAESELRGACERYAGGPRGAPASLDEEGVRSPPGWPGLQR